MGNAATLLLLFGVASVTSAAYTLARDTGVGTLEALRETDGRLREELRNRSVARNKVAPVQLPAAGSDPPQVHITLVFAMLAVLGVNDASQTVNTALYMTMQWVDPSLAWNATQYNINEIELPPDAIWTPWGLHVSNSRMQYLMDGVTIVEVTSLGLVSVSHPITLVTYCAMDLSHYPYDQQVCPIQIYSHDSKLNVVASHDDATSALVSSIIALVPEWSLLSVKMDSLTVSPIQPPSPKLLLTLRRKTTFYTVCLVMPMVVTSYMNTLVFLLPLQAGEKVSFLISIFVSTSVFTSYFTSVLPRGLNSVPDLMTLLLGVTLESLLVMLATVAVLRLHHQRQPSTATATATVAPAATAAAADETPKTENEKEGKTAKTVCWALLLKAERLDFACFVVSFVCNSVFLLSLFLPRQV